MNTIEKRKLSYISITIFLIAIYIFYRDSTWQGSTNLHTIMEVIATLLALMIGVSGLIRYNAKSDESLFLFIGAGFLGTGFLDGYHAIVTSEFFAKVYHSPPESLIPWSWIASRLYLSIFLFIAYYDWKKQINNSSPITPQKIYIITTISTLLSFIFFAFFPLPMAYYDELFFHRPEELLPALFFALALYGFYKKGGWKDNSFEYWLILSLIINLISQTIFMSFSQHLFDYEFDMAHLLKKLSYIAILTGLFISMIHSFKKEISSSNNLQKQLILKSLALKSGTIGIWEWDYKTNNLTWDETMYFMYDISKEDGSDNYEMWQKAIDSKDLPKIEKNLLNAKENNREYNAKFWITTPKNQRKYIHAIGINKFNDNGKLIGMIGVNTDITNQKNNEIKLQEINKNLEKRVEEEIKARKKKEELLIQQAKMASMGEMITNISHHWRQPLNIIGLNIQDILSAFDYGELDREYLEENINQSMEELTKMSEIINNFRDYLVKAPLKNEFELKDIINKTLKLVEPSLESHFIEVKTNLKNELYALGDGTKLIQSLNNILINSQEAFIERKISNKRVINILLLKEDNNWSKIVISDNAGGIEEDILARIFEPFFTTKELSFKTGTGLYFTKIFIEVELHGLIEAKNIKNGVEFIIKLPPTKK